MMFDMFLKQNKSALFGVALWTNNRHKNYGFQNIFMLKEQQSHDAFQNWLYIANKQC